MSFPCSLCSVLYQVDLGEGGTCERCTTVKAARRVQPDQEADKPADKTDVPKDTDKETDPNHEDSEYCVSCEKHCFSPEVNSNKSSCRKGYDPTGW